MTDEERRELDAAMARLARGDRSAAREVHDRLAPRVSRLCERMLGAGQDAEDATQEALAELFARAAEYDVGRSALSWALTIAAWECRSARKRRMRARTTALGDDAHESGATTPDAALEEAELRAALEAAITELRDDDRRVLDEVLGELRGDAAFRKRKQRMLDRLRTLIRRTYDL